MDIFEKAASALLDYDIDLSRWLADGDTIADVVTSVEPAESMVVASGVNILSDSIKVWVADGIPGKTARVRAFVTTGQGRKDPFDFLIRVTP